MDINITKSKEPSLADKFKVALQVLINQFIQEQNASCPNNKLAPLQLHEVELIITRDPDEKIAKDNHRCVSVRSNSEIDIIDSILFELMTEGKIFKSEYVSMTDGKG